MPHALAYDEHGDRLYVADRMNKRIQAFDSTGKFHMAYAQVILNSLSASRVA